MFERKNGKMKARRAAVHLAAIMILACALTTVLAPSAFAATVTGADCYEVGDTINILQADGEAGETVFVTVAKNGRPLVKDLAETLGEGGEASDGTAFFITLGTSGINMDALDGTYTVTVFATRDDSKAPIYEGALYGVYADLPDGTSKLIGTRTASAAEMDRAFQAPEMLYIDGVSLKLDPEAEGSDALHFVYKPYDEAKTVDGVIKYTDMSGAVVATMAIPGIEYGESREVDIPSAVTDDGNNVYRTVTSMNKVIASNPGQTSFTVQCVKMLDAAQAAANYYVATIQLADEDGNIIAVDSVNVTGEFLYTAPTVVYKTVTDAAGQSRVVTYRVKHSPLVRLSAATDGISGRERTITVTYEAEDPGAAQKPVTFNLIDGSKHIGEEGRLIDTVAETVDATNTTAQPPEQIEANGTTYYIVGAPSDYAYTFGSGELPVVDVYYTPEGYSAPGVKTVTVNYVDFLSNKVVGSQTVESSPDDLGAISIETPESFTADGVEYVKLAGQEKAISHSYYSGFTTYTVYYRNVNDKLTSGNIITTIRVVYTDDGMPTVQADEMATTRAEAEAADAREFALDEGRTYNVLDGDNGSSTLTNEEGVDSNTERIEDDYNPLAQGLESAADADGSQVQGIPTWALAVGAAAVLAVIAIVVWLVLRRRKAESNEQA